MATPSASVFPAAASALANSRITARIAARVLLVEPKPRARHVLKVALTRAGFEVVAVGSAAEAAPTLLSDQKAPSVVVSRAGLRGADGRRFRSELLLSEHLAQVPVVLLTRGGHLPGEDLVRMGVDDYLFKPFTARDVVALVRLKAGASSQDKVFSSTTAELPLAQLLRALLSGMSSGRIVTEHGTARIAFRRGAVVSATFEGSTERALLRTLLLARGPYRLEVGAVAEAGELTLGMHELTRTVLPVMRRWRDVTARAASLEARWRVDFLRLAQTAPGLPNHLHQLLQLFDGKRTVRDVLIAVSTDELADFISLNQLHQSGVLRGIPSESSPSLRRRIIEPLEWPVSRPVPEAPRIVTPLETRPATFPVSERQPEKLHLEIAASAALDELDDEGPSIWQWPEGLVLQTPAAADVVTPAPPAEPLKKDAPSPESGREKIEFTPLEIDEDTDEYWVDPALDLEAAPEPSSEAIREVLTGAGSANDDVAKGNVGDPFLAWAERAAATPKPVLSEAGNGAAAEEPQGLDLLDTEIAEAANLLSPVSDDAGLSTETELPADLQTEPNPAEVALETAVASLSNAVKFLTEMLASPDEEPVVQELSDEDILPDDVPVGPPPLPKAEPRATATGRIASVRPRGASSAVATLPSTLEQERTATQFPDAAESTASAAPFPSTSFPGEVPLAVESMTTPSIDVTRRNRTATLRPTSTRPTSSADALPALQKVRALAEPSPALAPRPPPPPADALHADPLPALPVEATPPAPRPPSRSEINPETSGVFARWLGEEDDWGGSNARLWAPRHLEGKHLEGTPFEALSDATNGLSAEVVRQLNAFRIKTVVEEAPEALRPVAEFPRPPPPIIPATSLDLRERAELHRLLRTRARTRLAFTTQDRTPVRYPLAAATAILGLAVFAFTAAAGIWPWSTTSAAPKESSDKGTKPSVTRGANPDLEIELEEVNIQRSPKDPRGDNNGE